MADILKRIKNKIIVSTQSSFGEPLYDENCMIAMMKSVVAGGADALRLAGVRDIKNAREIFPDIPIIGITKPKFIPENYKELVYITPKIEDAKAVIEAGADIIAFDGTMRKRPNDEKLVDIINYVKVAKKLSMADIATFEEAKNAEELGVDIVSTTLSGYTTESAQNSSDEPDFNLLERIVKELNCPVILEGRVWEPSQVAKAFELGAFAVVIGSAITRPHEIVKRFILKSGCGAKSDFPNLKQAASQNDNNDYLKGVKND